MRDTVERCSTQACHNSTTVVHVVPAEGELLEAVEAVMALWLDQQITASSLPHDVLATTIKTLVALTR